MSSGVDTSAAGGRPASAIEFHQCLVGGLPAAELVGEMREEIASLYDGLDFDEPRMPKAGAAELGPPHGTFVVGRENGIAVCCGGVKRLADGCEIKRMYVVPGARGRGVARALLEELEQRARSLGYLTVRLDTGPRQPRAQLMYERAGYAPIANFNGNPMASFFGEKQL